LLEAIIAATPQFGEITKSSENAYLKSKYLALPGLLRAIKVPLLEQGVLIYTQVAFAECGWVVRTTLHSIHTQEELSSDFPIPDPSNQQRVGSVITYGTRYNLFALLALCPEDADDDGNTGAVNTTAVAVQPLPGLPVPTAWPQQGQQATAPPAWPQQAPPAPQSWPQAPMALPQNPVQPLPVLPVPQ
jgi:hypothetical protein